ncbi:MAG: hypothetical protein U9N33_06010 [Campylobacterota bacterium]|nr:hypothetical protein [Campylobacterota bacterium]
MKNTAQILNLIQNRPQFSKLFKYDCIQKIQSLFSPALQKMIKFAYFKNNILFFVLNHPGAKQEFDNNIQSIKSALNFVQPDECVDILVTDIRAFVTNKPIKKNILFTNTDVNQTYRERATGNIEVNIKDNKLNKLVKSIQDIIKAKQKSQ